MYTKSCCVYILYVFIIIDVSKWYFIISIIHLFTDYCVFQFKDVCVCHCMPISTMSAYACAASMYWRKCLNFICPNSRPIKKSLNYTSTFSTSILTCSQDIIRADTWCSDVQQWVVIDLHVHCLPPKQWNLLAINCLNMWQPFISWHVLLGLSLCPFTDKLWLVLDRRYNKQHCSIFLKYNAIRNVKNYIVEKCIVAIGDTKWQRFCSNVERYNV